ncbi:uncharacterized protein N7459_001122 [Penicillium hispanicum]|uniref:uncharacterized protein n=1 Tax=Penicillium hispanicum TaxID=1080232 RepID=UPI00254185D2|nr:uncharacterized protein N7459_001122 [Penicillium hispanicum]KAJ5594914.1 hypothetical protein N7459_001122 [Penicillium hispanicum]
MSISLFHLLLFVSVIFPAIARPGLHRRAAIFHGDSCGSHRERAEKAFNGFPDLAQLANTLVYNYRAYRQGVIEEMDSVYIEGVEGGLKALLGITDFSDNNNDLDGYLGHLQYIYTQMAAFKDSTDPDSNIPLFCGIDSWLLDNHNGQTYTDQAGALKDGEQGGWDSVHDKWYKQTTLCPSGRAAVTAHFDGESPTDIVTLCPTLIDNLDTITTIQEPTDIVNNPVAGRLYSLWNMMRSYTGATFHEYTHTKWCDNMMDVLYDPSKADAGDQSMAGQDLLTYEEGGKPTLTWDELKILGRQNTLWALNNAETLSGLAMG